MSSVKNAFRVVLDDLGRYLNSDPTKKIEIGDYGEVSAGTLRKRGNIRKWFKHKGAPLPPNTGTAETSAVSANYEIASRGVKAHSVGLAGAIPGATMGLEVEFSEENQFYLHAPGMTWRGMENMGHVAEELTRRAELEDTDEGFWEDDFCVVTGIWEAPSFVRSFSRSKGDKMTFSVKNAQGMGALLQPGAQFEFAYESRRETSMNLAYTGGATVFIELSKVHWYVFGPKRWGVTKDFNP